MGKIWKVDTWDRDEDGDENKREFVHFFLFYFVIYRKYEKWEYSIRNFLFVKGLS